MEVLNDKYDFNQSMVHDLPMKITRYRLLGIGLILTSCIFIAINQDEHTNDKINSKETVKCSYSRKICQAIEQIIPMMSNWEKNLNCQSIIKIENNTEHNFTDLKLELERKKLKQSQNFCDVIIIIFESDSQQNQQNIEKKSYFQISIIKGRNKVSEDNFSIE